MSRLPPRTYPPTPPNIYLPDKTYEYPETPGPTRARVNNLQSQVSELVRKEHAAKRRHESETAGLQATIQSLQSQLKNSGDSKKAIECKDREIARMQQEGESMREELNMYSLIRQQKALLAITSEQMQMIELEQRLADAEAARLMRDHKITLFEAKESDLVAELVERDEQLAELEVGVSHWTTLRTQASLGRANTSLAHQRAAQVKADKLASTETQSQLSSARTQILSLEAEVQSLEGKLRDLRDREEEAAVEIETLKSQSKGEADTNKLVKSLQKELKDVKRQLETKDNELAEAQEEMSTLKENSKEREKSLKAKLKDAVAEKDRLSGVEEDLNTLRKTVQSSKTAVSSPKKLKPRPIESDESDEEPPKKAKKAIAAKPVRPAKKAATPLPDDEVSVDKSILGDKTQVENRGSKRKSPEPKSAKSKVVIPEIPEIKIDLDKDKKKKRKLLGGAAPAFTWDPIMNSGDGVIPAFLSPVKAGGKATSGLIPRLGSTSAAGSRTLGRFA